MPIICRKKEGGHTDLEKSNDFSELKKLISVGKWLFTKVQKYYKIEGN